MDGCDYSIDVIDIEQEDNTIETEEQFLLEPAHTKNRGRYVMVNICLDYQYRSKDLNTLCLYDFVSHFCADISMCCYNQRVHMYRCQFFRSVLTMNIFIYDIILSVLLLVIVDCASARLSFRFSLC